jgi:hypothetical protein
MRIFMNNRLAPGATQAIGMKRNTPGTKGIRATKLGAFKDELTKLCEELVEGGDKGLSRKAGTKPSEVCPKQLAMGIKVEREHSDNPKVQKEIAMDHLTEFPKYYTALAKAEKDLKAGKYDNAK